MTIPNPMKDVCATLIPLPWTTADDPSQLAYVVQSELTSVMRGFPPLLVRIGHLDLFPPRDFDEADKDPSAWRERVLMIRDVA